MLPLMRAIGQMTGKPTGLEKFDDGAQREKFFDL